MTNVMPPTTSDGLEKAKVTALFRPMASLTEEDVARWAAAIEVMPGAQLSPPVVGTDGGRPVLTEIRGPRFDARVQDRTAAPGQLRHIGIALAALHTAPLPGDGTVTPESPPWEALPLRVWGGLTLSQRQLTGTLHRDAALRRRGRAIHAALTSTAGQAWCHGDARTNNIVVSGDSPMFIDWECAGRGRPEVDLGSLCSSLITDELTLAQAPKGAEAHQELQTALRRAAAHISAVLGGYRAAEGHPLDPDLLGGAVGCGLLSRALMCASQTRRDRVVTGLTGMGRALVLDPARWKAIDAHG
ncbi:phosphotransferase [Streptomyces sp. NPDC090085]|uniref:phosphotransferase n=1 Tax=Streptomyces sp. NPDC090085 TaxID=3365943 RepID=UPI0037FE9176